MSDLRNFKVSNESDIGRTPIELSPIEPSLSELSVYESSPTLEENAPLSAFHTVEDDETSNTGRIVGGLTVALMLGAAAIYGYEVSSQSKQPMATQIAAKAPPAKPALATAPDQSADATPAASSTMAGPPATESTTPAAATVPMKKAPVRSAHVDSGSNNAPSSTSTQSASAQSAPVDTTPAQGLASVTPPTPASAGAPEQGAVQPVYPTAPASSLANSNPIVVAPETQPTQTPQSPEQQSSQAVTPTPDQAQPAPSTPAPE